MCAAVGVETEVDVALVNAIRAQSQVNPMILNILIISLGQI